MLNVENLTLHYGHSQVLYDVSMSAQAGAVTMNIGLFINAVISFLIVAWVLFLIVKGMNKLKKKEEAAPEAPAEPPRQEVLLEEIRDLLAKN